jgi:hypothetical protein
MLGRREGRPERDLVGSGPVFRKVTTLGYWPDAVSG